MNKHLSATEISEWIAGERSPESERHLCECPACRTELAGFESVLTTLGWAVRSWAAHQRVAPNLKIDIRRSPARLPWRWVPAAAVIGAAVLLPIRWNREAQREIARQEDSEFLAHIDEQLSREVPATMEPLMTLMQEGKDERK